MATVIGKKEASPGGETTVETRKKVSTVRYRDEVVYYVVADCTEGRSDVESATGLPQPYSEAYIGDILTKVIGLSSSEVSNLTQNPYTGNPGVLWEVTVKYDTNLDQEEDQNKDPKDYTPDVRWSSERKREPMTKDMDGEDFLTRAGEPLFFEEDVVCPVVEIKRYETYPFDPNKIADYENTCNEEEFYGAPKGCAIIDEITSEEEVIQSVRYCRVSYRIRFKFVRDDGGQLKEDTIAKQDFPLAGVNLYNEITGYDNENGGDGLTEDTPYFPTFAPAQAKDAKGQLMKVRINNEYVAGRVKQIGPFAEFGGAYFWVRTPPGDILEQDEETVILTRRIKRYSDFSELNFNLPNL